VAIRTHHRLAVTFESENWLKRFQRFNFVLI
jgi:hypothetical protein